MNEQLGIYVGNAEWQIDKMVGIERIPPGDATEQVPMFVNGKE